MIWGNQKKHIYVKSRDTVVAAVSPEKKHSAKQPPLKKKQKNKTQNKTKKTSQVLKDISLQSILTTALSAALIMCCVGEAG